jgi:hypothetical protein
MASLNEIAFDLLTIVRPAISDDSEIDIRQIKYWIKNQRSLFIRHELNKKRTIDPDLVQTICADLEEVDPSDCCGITLDCGKILRTTKEVPAVMEMHHREAITRVGPVNRMKPAFSYIEYDRVPYAGSGKFNGHLMYAFLHDKYMYIFSP